jgi:hypothetical protein
MKKYGPTRLTEAFVQKLPHYEKLYVVRDTKITGLLLVVNKHSKSYKIQRDLWTGHRGRRRLIKTVRYTLGCTDELNLDEARIRATEILSQIKRGTDPNAKPAVSAESWTVLRMYEEYQSDLATRDKSDRTIKDIMARLNRYLPKWKHFLQSVILIGGPIFTRLKIVQFL